MANWQTVSGSGDALTTGTLAQFAQTTIAQLNGVISGAGIVHVYDTRLLLKAVAPADGDVAYVRGRLTDNDGFEGFFQWDSARDAADDNDGTLVSDDGNLGLWVRLDDGVFNVKWFGATGNGSTDDTTAIQAAIDAAYGQTVFFPDGIYMTSGITLSQDTWLLGSSIRNNEANGKCILKANANLTSGLINITGPMSRIEKLTLHGDYDSGGYTGHGLLFDNANAWGSVVRDCQIRDFSGNAIRIEDVNAIRIENCNIVGADTIVCYFDGADKLYFVNNLLQGSGSSALPTSIIYITVSGASKNPHSSLIESNWFEYTYNKGADYDGFTQSLIKIDAQCVTFSENHINATMSHVATVTDMDGAAGTVTCTSVAHEFNTGDTVTISGATTSAWNAQWVITVVDVDTFTFAEATEFLNDSGTATLNPKIIHIESQGDRTHILRNHIQNASGVTDADRLVVDAGALATIVEHNRNLDVGVYFTNNSTGGFFCSGVSTGSDFLRWYTKRINIYDHDSSEGIFLDAENRVIELGGSSDFVGYEAGTFTVEASTNLNLRTSHASGNIVVSDGTGGAGYDKGHLSIGGLHLWKDTSSVLRFNTSAPSSATDGEPIAGGGATLTCTMELGTATNQAALVFPYSCTVTNIYITNDRTTDGASNEIITFKNNAGSTITDGAITITQSQSRGTVWPSTPSANNTFTAGQRMTCDTDGAGSVAAICNVTVLVTRT